MSDFRIAAPANLSEAVFIRRLNRFLVECETEGIIQQAFLPNPGRLWEYLFPGTPLIVQSHHGQSDRKTSLTVTGTIKDGNYIMLNTHASNRAVSWLIDNQLIPGLEPFRVIREEVSLGSSRFDLLLEDGQGPFYMEVKSCTLFGNSIAMFPDAPSERAARHVRELHDMVLKGARAGVIFLVQSRKPSFFLPDYHTDPVFAKALYHARKDLRVMAVSVSWDNSLTIERTGAGILEIPWEIVAREANDSGCYMLLLELTEQREISVGSLGRISFPAGFYIYVGSARKGLEKRISRHLRKRKRFQWHIDYLRDQAEKVKALPVRTSISMECELAERIGKISDNPVRGFGCSDCQCQSHLFFMEEDPLQKKTFVQTLIDIRINRLEELWLP